MEPFDTFNAIAADPLAYAQQWKQRSGGRVVGYFCTYTPEEIIWAAGALPYRLLDGAAEITRADAHLQVYACSLVRGALEEALNGRLAFLDGTVFVHTCDSMQRLSDIWRLNVAEGFHSDVVLPVKLHSPSARDYLYEILGSFKAKLGRALDSEITAQRLSAAVETYRRIRSGLKRLYLQRSRRPEALSGRTLDSVLRAASVMDRAELAEALEAAGEAVARQDALRADVVRKRLILAGGPCTLPDIQEAVEAAGGTVVWDDLCTGARYFERQAVHSASGLEAVADRLLQGPLCPAKHAGLDVRAEHLLGAAREHRADGVIFVQLKFCDPHSFDHPTLKRALDSAGIPSMLYEIDEQSFAEGQLTTRVQAFIEML